MKRTILPSTDCEDVHYPTDKQNPTNVESSAKEKLIPVYSI
jgi:hypothetical protein